MCKTAIQSFWKGTGMKVFKGDTVLQAKEQLSPWIHAVAHSVLWSAQPCLIFSFFPCKRRNSAVRFWQLRISPVHFSWSEVRHTQFGKGIVLKLGKFLSPFPGLSAVTHIAWAAGKISKVWFLPAHFNMICVFTWQCLMRTCWNSENTGQEF